ncbi:MAG: hypothetical protein ACKVP5_22295 [Aestuariivirga sp.]
MAQHTRGDITLRFQEIEPIVGARLPPSAYNHREWWSNQSDVSNRPQARSWIDAGFKVDMVQQHPRDGVVRFVKS